MDMYHGIGPDRASMCNDSSCLEGCRGLSDIDKHKGGEPTGVVPSRSD